MSFQKRPFLKVLLQIFFVPVTAEMSYWTHCIIYIFLKLKLYQMNLFNRPHKSSIIFCYNVIII